MGNLVLPAGIGNMSKGVISVWVRIPAATAAAAEAGASEFTPDYEVFNAVIPLITWGEQQEGTIYEWSFPPIFEQDPNTPPVDLVSLGPEAFISGDHTNYRPPSYLGIKCDEGGLFVDVNIQSYSFPTCDNTAATIENLHLEEANPPGGVYYNAFDSTEVSHATEGTQTYFGWVSSFNIGGTDTWHHIIISWDVSDGCSVTGSGSDVDESDEPYSDYITASGMMWFAVDDVNKNEFDLPAMWLGSNGGDADSNAIVTELCASFSGVPDLTLTGSVVQPDYEYGTPSVIETAATIPSAPVCIPSDLNVIKPTDNSGANTTVSPNLNIIVAEMQVFSDVSLDLSIEANRRAFVLNNGSSIRPASPSLAAALLGKSPEIYFRTHTDWIEGNNSGTAGNFTPTGTVLGYTPGP